jgi:transketolase
VVADGGDAIVIATGSEVSLALRAREALAADGVGVRVVSMPSMELFRRQEKAYREEVLPAGITARVSVEAASPFGWSEWTGSAGARVGIDRFGVSAPGPEGMAALGMTPEHVASAVKEVLDG